jgi:DNA-binding IscR family transcriptional regulator
MIKLREAGLIKAKAGVDGGYRLDKETDDITLSEIAKSVSNDYIHVTWHNGMEERQIMESWNTEDGREAIKDSKVEQAIDSIFVDLNEACDNLLKNKTIEDIMNISK